MMRFHEVKKRLFDAPSSFLLREVSIGTLNRKAIIDAAINNAVGSGGTDEYWYEKATKEIEDEMGDDFDDEKKEVRDAIEKRAYEIAYDQLDDIYGKIESDFENLPNPFDVFRCINVPIPDNKTHTFQNVVEGIRLDEIGVYWSYDEGAAECHWGGGSGYRIILKAEVNQNNVEWDATMELNLDPSTGEDEKEIRLKEHTPIHITQIKVANQWRQRPIKDKWYDVDLRGTA